MYQENNNNNNNNNSIMMNGVCTSPFDNNYSPSWMQGTNRQSPPPRLAMVKQEQHQDWNKMMPSVTNMDEYYGTMCQPLVIDDSSYFSSPCGGGPVLLSPCTDVFSPSNSSSPSMDDQLFDCYSPIQSHCPYPMEQRHSFDQAMFINNSNNNMMPTTTTTTTYIDEQKPGYTMYCCSNVNANANNSHYQLESPIIPSPSLSSSSLSYYHPHYTNQMPPPSPAVPRHHSMPSLYHYQHQQQPSSSSSSSLSPSSSSLSQLPSPSPSSSRSAAGLAGFGLGLGFGSESERIRPYQCHLCTRGFARKHDLQRHIRVHTGDKPFPCLCCKKAFARTDALKRHLRMEEHCRNSPQIQNMKNTGKRRYKNL